MFIKTMRRGITCFFGNCRIKAMRRKRGARRYGGYPKKDKKLFCFSIAENSKETEKTVSGFFEKI